jgi:predicted phage terminase large subunit-like protein
LQARCEVDNDPLGRERGEYLWPEWFDRKHWAQFEANPRTWAALFQQIPSPLDGDLFKPDQIGIVDALPAGDIKWCHGWDLASVTDDGDWTAGGKLGRLADGRFVIADMARFQRGPDERDAAIVNAAQLDGRPVKVSIPQDPGQAGKTQVIYLTRKLAGFTVVSSPETGDKVTRAEPFAAQVNAGNVLMLRGPWNQTLINELRMFPNGKHDDQVDALSRAFAEIMVPRRSWFG